LRDDIQNMRLSGVIHATGTVESELAQWQDKFGTPGVVIVPSHMSPGAAAAVVLSYDSFFSRAIEFLAKRGRRRAALILTPEIYFQGEQGHIDREAARCGIEIRPMWRQFVGLGVPVAARSVTHLLLGAPAADRPEGLIVADDNLVSQALQGVQDAGGRPGTALDVVVHANFPDASPSRGDGVARLGFDSRAILRAAVRLIEAWRKTGQHAGSAEVNAVFEEELWEPVPKSAAPVGDREG
jgi:DNA-binding LacI/PurR family transcriptional regulator